MLFAKNKSVVFWFFNLKTGISKGACVGVGSGTWSDLGAFASFGMSNAKGSGSWIWNALPHPLLFYLCKGSSKVGTCFFDKFACSNLFIPFSKGRTIHEKLWCSSVGFQAPAPCSPSASCPCHVGFRMILLQVRWIGRKLCAYFGRMLSEPATFPTNLGSHVCSFLVATFHLDARWWEVWPTTTKNNQYVLWHQPECKPSSCSERVWMTRFSHSYCVASVNERQHWLIFWGCMWTICLGQLTLTRFSVIVSKAKQSTPLCRPRKNSDILRQNVRYRQPRRQSILSSCVGRIPQTNLRFYNVSVRELNFFDAVTPPLMLIEIVLGQTGCFEKRMLRWTIGWVGYVGENKCNTMRCMDKRMAFGRQIYPIVYAVTSWNFTYMSEYRRAAWFDGAHQPHSRLGRQPPGWLFDHCWRVWSSQVTAWLDCPKSKRFRNCVSRDARVTPCPFRTLIFDSHG